MLALVTDSSSATRLRLSEVEAPAPRANEAVVRVSASSLNRGEVKRLAAAPDGTIPGWDLAGVLEQPAADGGGPPRGTRVAGIVSSGAWAEQVAVPVSQLAEVPEQVELETAGVIPVAGLTALGVLRAAGSLFGRRVAVTGAAGGVGRYAVQLAAEGGAHVTAVVGSQTRGESLRGLGASELKLDLASDDDEYDVVLESAGGASLVGALTSIGPDGTIVAFGNSSGEPTAFNVVGFYGRAPGARMVGFTIFDDLARRGQAATELEWLLARIDMGTLDPGIATRASWRELDEPLRRLLAREVPGKHAILLD